MPRKFSMMLEKEDRYQYLVGFFLLVVYAGALFFPLMDKDAAHHANIALNMLQRNDYASLIDRHMDYLDKPHFLFWVSAFSFKIFGVNTFAYRLPAVLFALSSIVSTYSLAKHLSDKTTAKLTAVMLATAQGFILSINDARMETPLMAAIIFGLWQLIVYIDTKKLVNIILSGLGIAIAFSTKGWIGSGIILVSAFFYILLNKKWNLLAERKTWLIIPLFLLFISPVLYAYYLQFDKHPEKIIRNMDHISGIRFILWSQNFERFGGDNFAKGGRNSSYFFLYHTFLWAFFPWCIIAYAAVVYWVRRMVWGRKWKHPFNFAALAFAVILFTISFSKFKMPHYIFMLLPLAALFTAPYLRLALSYSKPAQFYLSLHMIIAALVIVVIVLLNYYFFPPQTLLIKVAGPLLLILLLWLMIRRNKKSNKLIYVTVAFAAILNFFMNYNFFPGLMKYQGGNELAFKMQREHVEIPDTSIYLLEVNAHSFDFYRGYNHDIVEIKDLPYRLPSMRDAYFLLSSEQIGDIEAQHLSVKPVISQLDYNVARMKLKFLNPKTRPNRLDTLMLARIEPR